ncbi:hypothetical protein KY284_026229 [Solanum tuberosum]|nr:hypothetical protein KY284_026229 [Solanum tuberosum]
MCRKQSTHQIKGPNTYFGVDASRVYVKGGTRKEEQPLEVEVYNQGMFKMELCNKCKETGAHPYGEACHQFSHGIEDLLPVIRHPLYKTEVGSTETLPLPHGGDEAVSESLQVHQTQVKEEENTHNCITSQEDGVVIKRLA